MNLELKKLIEERDALDKRIAFLQECTTKYNYMPEESEAAFFSNDGKEWYAKVFIQHDQRGYNACAEQTTNFVTETKVYRFCKPAIDPELLPVQGDPVWVRNEISDPWSLAVCEMHDPAGIMVNSTYEGAMDEKVEPILYSYVKRAIPGVKP